MHMSDDFKSTWFIKRACFTFLIRFCVRRTTATEKVLIIMDDKREKKKNEKSSDFRPIGFPRGPDDTTMT